MIYSRTETHEGSDCLITKDAHIVPVYRNGSELAYVATCSTIRTGYMGFNTTSESFVFDDPDRAKEYCDTYFTRK